MLSLNPNSFTLRELAWMAEAKLEEDWNLTSALIAMIFNVNCTKKKDLKSPNDFHPLHSKKENVWRGELGKHLAWSAMKKMAKKRSKGAVKTKKN